MSDHELVFTTPAAATPWKRWMLYSPFARILIFALMMVVLTIALYTPFREIGWTAKDAAATKSGLVEFVVRALAPLIAYLLLVRLIERRSIAELAPGKLIPGGLMGISAGLTMVSATVGILALLDSYHVIGFNSGMNWLGMLTLVGLGAAIGEEVMFRGVLFRIVEEGLGSWWALALSALFFGAIHFGNQGATFWSSIAIAVDAGLMLGLLYHVTRSLPVCMGLHAAWNFFQGPFYGTPVSGFKAEGWLVSTLSGPDWLTGGEFGLEGSVVMVAVCSLITLGLLIVALRRGSLVPCRPWQRLRHRNELSE